MYSVVLEDVEIKTEFPAVAFEWRNAEALEVVKPLCQLDMTFSRFFMPNFEIHRSFYVFGFFKQQSCKLLRNVFVVFTTFIAFNPAVKVVNLFSARR